MRVTTRPEQASSPVTGDPAMAPPRPRLWVACPQVGSPSQPWLTRQVLALDRFDVTVVTREVLDPDRHPLGDIPIELVPELRLVDTGFARWTDRLSKLRGRNFFGMRRRQVYDVARRFEGAFPQMILAHFGHVAAKLEPLAALMDVPIVAHFHGVDLDLTHRWYRWSLKRILPMLAGAIVVGSHQRETLLSMGVPASKIHLIPCGVPVDEFATPLRTSDDGPVRFIAVSRLVPGKGVDLTIRAFAKVAEHQENLSLTIVGDGPLRDDLEALVDALNLAKRVRFTGFLPSGEVGVLMARSDVFVQHSVTHGGWVEGFGVSISEAAASALPVVVSDSGGVADQVRHGTTGYLVAPGDTEGMAARMELLAADSALRQRLGVQALEHVRANFNTPDLVQTLQDVLEDAMSVSLP